MSENSRFDLGIGSTSMSTDTYVQVKGQPYRDRDTQVQIRDQPKNLDHFEIDL